LVSVDENVKRWQHSNDNVPVDGGPIILDRASAL
jgi:hypothetical protein